MNDLEKLGYQVKGGSSEKLDVFIEQYFPNFKLLQLLKTVENTFTPTSYTPINRIIEMDVNNRTLKVHYRNEFNTEDDALVFIRTFTNDDSKIYVSHDYCIIPKTHRGKGLVKIIFQESLMQYENMKTSKILVHAGLSSGGYVWAKHGFRAINEREIIVILEKAHKPLSSSDFSDVKLIYDTYYDRNPKGKSFPIILWAEMDCMKPVLMNSDWHGELDLRNSIDHNNFKNYVFR